MEMVAHAARLASYVEPHRARRSAGIKHPVHDFIFTYYSYRPAQLMRWHAAGLLASSKIDLAEATVRLLRATAAREANFGCFGLHEWAMVYRSEGGGGTRHPQPLRLGSGGTDAVVDAHRLRCSHWDAVRFFTPPARPLNTLSPQRDDRDAFEQPACLHTNMDLYKHAYRLAEVVGSDLVADAFELAWDIRIADMRAAPYDLGGILLDPHDIKWTSIEVETPAGKREYAQLQQEFAERAAVIRQKLIDVLVMSLERVRS